MKKTKKRRVLLSLAIVGLACGVQVPSVGHVSAEGLANEMEYSRISMGGGYSAQGGYVVDDAITQSTAAAPQKSSRFEISGVKTDGEGASFVDNWQVI